MCICAGCSKADKAVRGKYSSSGSGLATHLSDSTSSLRRPPSTGPALGPGGVHQHSPPVWPKIFAALADALAWILCSNGIIHQLHCLDNCLLLGLPDDSGCGRSLHKTLRVCQNLGVSIATHKTEGPRCCLTFLGIGTMKTELSLPTDKHPHYGTSVCLGGENGRL